MAAVAMAMQFLIADPSIGGSFSITGGRRTVTPASLLTAGARPQRREWRLVECRVALAPHLQPFVLSVAEANWERHGVIDVYRPRDTNSERRPVIVFIHGGPLPPDSNPRREPPSSALQTQQSRLTGPVSQVPGPGRAITGARIPSVVCGGGGAATEQRGSGRSSDWPSGWPRSCGSRAWC
jgi:hypothetical protein